MAKTMTAMGAIALLAAAQLASVADAKRARGASGGGARTNISGPADRGAGGRDISIDGGDYHGGHNDIDIDVDTGWNNGHWDDHWHPAAAAIAIGTTVAVTRAVVGTRVYVLPSSSCELYLSGGTTYYVCGEDWYTPQYVGTQVTYVVVVRPY